MAIDAISFEDDEEEPEEDVLYITICNDEIEVSGISYPYRGLDIAEITTENGTYLIGAEQDFEYTVREEWENMDSRELIATLGGERIVDMWISGTSFSDFVDDIVAEYEQHVPSYDGISRYVGSNDELDEELGFTPEVAFLQ